MTPIREKALRLFSAVGRISAQRTEEYAYPRLLVYTDNLMELDLLMREFGGVKSEREGGYTWQLSSRTRSQLMLEDLIDLGLLDEQRKLQASLVYLLTNWFDPPIQLEIFEELKRVTSLQASPYRLSTAFLSQLAGGGEHANGLADLIETATEPEQPPLHESGALSHVEDSGFLQSNEPEQSANQPIIHNQSSLPPVEPKAD